MRVFWNLLVFLGAAGLMMLVSMQLYDVLAGLERLVQPLSTEWWSSFGILYGLSGLLLLAGIIGTMRRHAGPSHDHR